MLHFMNMTTARFKTTIWNYYRAYGRDLPWRRTRDPYAILISEIMLQQTQVSRVEGYYERFLKRFPDFVHLARAKKEDILRIWQGLGYNRRALSLWKMSKIISREFNGKLPRDRQALESLPGIGKGTSGALRAFAFNEPEVFVETNIRRVFIHFFFSQRNKVTDEELERYIKRTLDHDNPREWYWALMDYGAMLGRMPKSAKSPGNPNRRSAHYKKQSPFAGSDRKLRGEILRLVLSGKKINMRNPRVKKIASILEKEGFIKI
jgi:A/G-specific adenine glycosylase